jgi:hemolysin III
MFPLKSKSIKYKEELFNSISHGVGVGLSITGLVVMLAWAINRGDGFIITSISIYGISLLMLYTASTLYHSWMPGRIKHWLKVADHAAIYLLIAGTYTPFSLVLLPPKWGWPLLGVIWALATVGMVFKVFYINKYNYLSTVMYLIMGWLVLFAINPLLESLPAGGLTWLLAGGLSYTLGCIFYIWDRLPFNHGIWHIFVLFGSICHFFSILLYVIPAGECR